MADQSTPHPGFRQTSTINGRTTEQLELGIPIYIEEGVILHGLYQGVLSGGNEKTEFSVGCGAGLGSDHVSMMWKEGDEKHQCTFYLRDVLKAWVATFDPEAAAALPSVDVEVDEPEVVREAKK